MNFLYSINCLQDMVRLNKQQVLDMKLMAFVDEKFKYENGEVRQLVSLIMFVKQKDFQNAQML